MGSWRVPTFSLPAPGPWTSFHYDVPVPGRTFAVGDIHGDLAALQTLFARHGESFLVLPNRSQYPLSCFFDTLYHLNEDCQKAHSTQVATALAQMAVVTDALRARP